MERNHEKYMKRCLELGANAKANGRAAVGSLILQQEEIIAEGIEGAEILPASLAHAEILAIVEAIEHTGSNDLSDCTLYTTVEPCAMCSYLIRQTKIREVVFGVRTASAGGVSSGYPILTLKDILRWQSPPVITEGILKEDCLYLLQK